MPLEIRELIIKATVEEQKKNGADNKGNGRISSKDRQIIVQECMSQMRELLRELEER